ncbi:hypothetical protein AWB70_03610 [Caballeronia cordobensis]|uniref:Uncharacterized protein n=1 Tax=Caballeronia cordobensis TaxID=1353886 RepID=A0A158HPS5_CABCO|nr:hypothetical protein [Caballeronia cordobensis]SAL46009.1 hypothetical protein AWB70_03610 [Caballeronia cordobensis]
MHAHDQAELLLRTLNAPRRNHFFYGKRMDVQQFQMEQDYGRNKQWLLNRLTLGKGVLCGLKVSIDGDRLCVDPGVAIDGLGREIIVPVRACIDPKAEHGGCCGDAPPAGSDPAHGDARLQVFTLWLCYRECQADQQPVLVTDCETQSHCAPDTVVETFCLKVTPGIPPLQGDPDWCLAWARGAEKPQEPREPDSDRPVPDRPDGAAPPDSVPVSRGPAADDVVAVGALLATLGVTQEEIDAAGRSRRHALCSLFDKTCDPAEGSACVPLAIGLVRDERIAGIESCLVRPRVYSNAVLLDLILCLAERVDACCNGHEPPPPPPQRELLRVQSVTFLSTDPNGVQTEVGKVDSPMEDVRIKISLRPNAIRIRFTEDFARDVHIPSTHGLNDPNFKRHNVMVLPDEPLNHMEYVPGTLVLEDSRTIRFDLFRDSPYVRGSGGGFGWQKGRYQLAIFGTDDAGASRHAIADTGDVALDGDTPPAGSGAISGDGTPGGDFRIAFIIR